MMAFERILSPLVANGFRLLPNTRADSKRFHITPRAAHAEPNPDGHESSDDGVAKKVDSYRSWRPPSDAEDGLADSHTSLSREEKIQRLEALMGTKSSIDAANQESIAGQNDAAAGSQKSSKTSYLKQWRARNRLSSLSREEQIQQLEKMFAKQPIDTTVLREIAKSNTPPMGSAELKELVQSRWGKPYETRICKRRDGLGKNHMYLQVIWQPLGQSTFSSSEAQYNDQLNKVAEIITDWGCADQVRAEVPRSSEQPYIKETGSVESGYIMIKLHAEVKSEDHQWEYCSF
jgi:hypothetical protein